MPIITKIDSGYMCEPKNQKGNVMVYRRFKIDAETCGFYNYSAVIDSYDGEHGWGYFYADTIEELKQEIDNFYDENPELEKEIAVSTEPTTLEQVREYAKNLGKDHEEFIQAVVSLTYSLEHVQAELNQIKATGDVFAN